MVASFPGSAGAAATAGAAPSHAAKLAVSDESRCVALAAAHGPLATYLVYHVYLYSLRFSLPNTCLAQSIFTAADKQIFFLFLEIRFYSACILLTKIDAGII